MPDLVRACTVRYPHGACIASGLKTTENRIWWTAWTGWLLIHQGLGRDRTVLGANMFEHVRAALDASPETAHLPGHVIAIARMTGCHAADGCCEPFGFATGYHFTLEDIHALTNPVPAVGKLGLWKPGDDLVAEVCERNPQATAMLALAA